MAYHTGSEFGPFPLQSDCHCGVLLMSKDKALVHLPFHKIEIFCLNIKGPEISDRKHREKHHTLIFFFLMSEPHSLRFVFQPDFTQMSSHLILYINWNLPFKGVNYFFYIFNNLIIWSLLDPQALVDHCPSENTQEICIYISSVNIYRSNKF